MDADSAYDGHEDLGADPSLSIFKGKQNVDESSLASFSSNPKSKKIKVKNKNKAPIVNPDEPVRDSWIKVPSDEFENDRLVFNPYAFGKPTCSDSRFYCKMHRQMFDQLISPLKNWHVPTFFFNVDNAREVWLEVMEIMDYHNITNLMPVNTSYAPELLQEFYATIYFSREGPRTMIWMSAGVKCEASLVEFGALFGIEELPHCPMAYVRIHLQTVMKATHGIHHCYPSESGSLGKIPKVSHMTPFWKAIYFILRNTIAVKFGEKGMARMYMVNLLHHIISTKERNKWIDVLDYMWQEMHSVVLESKVPIYGPYLQWLFEVKLSPVMLNAYVSAIVEPTLHALPPRPSAAVIPTQAKHSRLAAPEAHVEEEAHFEVPKKKQVLRAVLKKMNCFSADKQAQDYKAYRKHKDQNRDIRAMMTKLEVPCRESSSEVSENTFMSKNTYWFGDYSSSLAPYWPGSHGASSSGPAFGDSHEEIESEDDEDEDYDV